MEENKIDKAKVLNKGKSTLNEFKEFISKGNVMDLAVGVIIGNAFGKIVTSLVDNILMPLIGMLIGGLNFTDLKFHIGNATVSYGIFIQNVIDFLIIAACIFVMVKMIAKFNRKEEVPEEEPKKDEQVVLLEEIRDLLKQK